jgi:hypothetical protein
MSGKTGASGDESDDALTNWSAYLKLAGMTLTPLVVASAQTDPAVPIAGQLTAVTQHFALQSSRFNLCL